MMNSSAPTPHPDVNAFLQPLLTGINAILGSDAVAIYLDGSLANGDFDAASDIDFLVVTERDITPQQFAALKQMHINLVGTDSPWAVQLEGSYLSRQAIRRYDPEHALHPNLERGPGEVPLMVVYMPSGKPGMTRLPDTASGKMCTRPFVDNGLPWMR